MNITELTNNVYRSDISSLKSIESISPQSIQSLDTDVIIESFEDVLEEKLNSNSTNDNEKNTIAQTSDLNSILLDASSAKEYLESKTGRQLLVSMAENSIAQIITGADNNNSQ